jgi:hypothetical protein
MRVNTDLVEYMLGRRTASLNMPKSRRDATLLHLELLKVAEKEGRLFALDFTVLDGESSCMVFIKS